MIAFKDLHRTGWSGISGEAERIHLKRVLLGYARFNKTIGYCQGFNVIAALVLEVTEFKEECALKVVFHYTFLNAFFVFFNLNLSLASCVCLDEFKFSQSFRYR